jgi:hypothetical protein
MRTELELIAQIEKYLLGEMSSAEKKSFEEEINKDASLKQKVEAQRKIIEAVKQNALKASVKTGLKKAKLKSKLFKGGAGLTILTLAVISVLMLSKNKSNANLLHELNEKGTKDWAMADKNVSPQVFQIDNTKDTVIETKGGMILAIPAGSFKTAKNENVNKPVELEVKEALDPATILSSGLSTMSGDRPLETGGMFYISARLDGDPLKIDPAKPINANVPTAEKKPGMLLFEGLRRTDGTIDWIAPKEIEKDLLTVDITSLNFYPPKYEDSLEGMGYDRHDKKFTDSLYFSFAALFDKSDHSVTDTTVEYQLLPESLFMSEAKPNPDRALGKKVFKANCAACHNFRSVVTGPALIAVFHRVPQPADDWLYKYIKNNNKVIASGDAYARKLNADNDDVDGMGEFEFLSDFELRSLIDFMKTGGDEPIDEGQPFNYSNIQGINPAKIQSIWNEKFNNTILATKEFEERLKVIHKTYNENVLLLYVNNLDKPLWKIDSMAAQIASFPESEKFKEFMARREGGVKMKNSVTEKLSRYFEEKQKAYTEAAKKTLEKFYSENSKAEKKFSELDEAHQEEALKTESDNFERELDINLKEAYRQLGKPWPTPRPAPAYYSVRVVDMGWKNVDVYTEVFASTKERKTLDFTDQQSGKKAVIKYETVSVNVANDAGFDKIFAYVLADGLASYQLMYNSPEFSADAKGNDISFELKLNELLKYDLVIVGFKGGEKYIYTENSIGRNTIKRINLTQSPESQINNTLSKMGRGSPTQKLEQEIEFRIKQKNEIIRKQNFEKAQNLRERIIPVIFISGSELLPH